VEVTLIAQLGPRLGQPIVSLERCNGNVPIRNSWMRWTSHPRGWQVLTIEKGENSALFSFAVGAQGHPFHRHAGHRIFTAVSGSGGAQLRFSTASAEQIERDPRSFVSALHYVDIPPDCLFTVRFGGGTWHQFASRRDHGRHPVFFALSCHTNELGGELDGV
jgi:hypothetical protein